MYEVKQFASDHPKVLRRADKSSFTALDWAIKHDKMPIFLWLLEQRVSVNRADSFGSTTINFASQFKHGSKYVQTLLKHGANPNMGRQEMPLHSAAFEGDMRIIRLLLFSSASANAKIKSGTCPGCTPLDYALIKKHTNAAALLILYGANLAQSKYFSLNEQERKKHFVSSKELAKAIQSFLQNGVEEANGLSGAYNAYKALSLLDIKCKVCNAMKLQLEGKVDKAKVEYKKAAKTGDAEAMYRLCNIHKDDGDSGKANYWCEKAGDLGNHWATIHMLSEEKKLNFDSVLEVEGKNFIFAMIASARFSMNVAGFDVGVSLLTKARDLGSAIAEEYLIKWNECRSHRETDSALSGCFSQSINDEWMNGLVGKDLNLKDLY